MVESASIAAFFCASISSLVGPFLFFYVAAKASTSPMSGNDSLRTIPAGTNTCAFVDKDKLAKGFSVFSSKT